MKFSTIICVVLLIFCGLNAGISTLFNFNLLLFICFNNKFIYDILNGFFAISALFTCFWAIAFKPFNNIG